MIKASICLSDIPKDKITLSTKNGKKYLDIIIDTKKQPDNYGNTHGIYISQTKEEREAKTERVYIGNGKEMVFNNQPTPAQAPQPNNSQQPGDDLPF